MIKLTDAYGDNQPLYFNPAHIVAIAYSDNRPGEADVVTIKARETVKESPEIIVARIADWRRGR